VVGARQSKERLAFAYGFTLIHLQVEMFAKFKAQIRRSITTMPPILREKLAPTLAELKMRSLPFLIEKPEVRRNLAQALLVWKI
jgi:hypothetical protein